VATQKRFWFVPDGAMAQTGSFRLPWHSSNQGIVVSAGITRHPMMSWLP
jgi:hypothetical protein